MTGRPACSVTADGNEFSCACSRRTRHEQRGLLSVKYSYACATVFHALGRNTASTVSINETNYGLYGTQVLGTVFEAGKNKGMTTVHKHGVPFFFSFFFPFPRAPRVGVSGQSILFPRFCQNEWGCSESSRSLRKPGKSGLEIPHQVAAVWLLCSPSEAATAVSQTRHTDRRSQVFLLRWRLFYGTVRLRLRRGARQTTTLNLTFTGQQKEEGLHSAPVRRILPHGTAVCEERQPCTGSFHGSPPCWCRIFITMLNTSIKQW